MHPRRTTASTSSGACRPGKPDRARAASAAVWGCLHKVYGARYRHLTTREKNELGRTLASQDTARIGAGMAHTPRAPAKTAQLASSSGLRPSSQRPGRGPKPSSDFTSTWGATTMYSLPMCCFAAVWDTLKVAQGRPA